MHAGAIGLSIAVDISTCEFTKWGDKGEFVDPEHLAIDSQGNVYVSDRANNNIQVFKIVTNPKN